ncbi:hypothetical protein WJX74_006799 [Apatococcus lobatus]|uniref:Uncharacterized protein n=1 Tax=Apatococcus lobatus TaxID=904363 RepID=A0AAW1QZ81_9CHLO
MKSARSPGGLSNLCDVAAAATLEGRGFPRPGLHGDYDLPGAAPKPQEEIKCVEVDAFASVHDMIHAAIQSYGASATLREIYRACEARGRIAYKRSGGSRLITQNDHWKSQIRHALYTCERFARAPDSADSWMVAKHWDRVVPQTTKVLVRSSGSGTDAVSMAEDRGPAHRNPATPQGPSKNPKRPRGRQTAPDIDDDEDEPAPAPTRKKPRNPRPAQGRGSSHSRAWHMMEGVAEAGSDSPLLAGSMAPHQRLSPGPAHVYSHHPGMASSHGPCPGPFSATWGSYPEHEHEDESSELAAVPRVRYDEVGSGGMPQQRLTRSARQGIHQMGRAASPMEHRSSMQHFFNHQTRSPPPHMARMYMGDGRDAWDAWPSRAPAQQALSHADISGTSTPSAAWQTNLSAPSFGPMSGHADAGGAEADSPSIPWQGYHLRPRTAQNPRPAITPRPLPGLAAAQASAEEAEMEVSASLGPIKKRLKAAAKAAAAAGAAAAEVTSGAGGLAGSGGRLLEASTDLPQQDGPVTRRMFHMQQDQQHGTRSQKDIFSRGPLKIEDADMAGSRDLSSHVLPQTPSMQPPSWAPLSGTTDTPYYAGPQGSDLPISSPFQGAASSVAQHHGMPSYHGGAHTEATGNEAADSDDASRKRVLRSHTTGGPSQSAFEVLRRAQAMEGTGTNPSMDFAAERSFEKSGLRPGVRRERMTLMASSKGKDTWQR